MRFKVSIILALLAGAMACVLVFQNCSQHGDGFQAVSLDIPPNNDPPPDDEPPEDPGDPPPQPFYDQLAVKVFRYSFEAVPEMNASFSIEEIEADFEVTNEIWAQAEIDWAIESIENVTVSSSDFNSSHLGLSGPDFREIMRSIAPPAMEKTWNVVYIHHFPVPASGLYIGGTNTVFYGEYKNGEHAPVVLAHELGHSLNLSHVNDSANLMTGGKPDNLEYAELTASQVEVSREQFPKGPL